MVKFPPLSLSFPAGVNCLAYDEAIMAQQDRIQQEVRALPVSLHSWGLWSTSTSCVTTRGAFGAQALPVSLHSWGLWSTSTSCVTALVGPLVHKHFLCHCTRGAFGAQALPVSLHSWGLWCTSTSCVTALVGPLEHKHFLCYCTRGAFGAQALLVLLHLWGLYLPANPLMPLQGVLALCLSLSKTPNFKCLAWQPIAVGMRVCERVKEKHQLYSALDKGAI